MTDPILFESATPRFGLPLLHAGQAQKEAFVNEALAIADSQLHGCVEGEADTPPATPEDGQNWLIAPDATGEWEGRDGWLACRQAGNWIYVPARDGMRIFDRDADQQQFFAGSWRKATPAVEPVGGTTVDVQARTAIGELIAALRAMGIFPSL